MITNKKEIINRKTAEINNQDIKTNIINKNNMTPKVRIIKKIMIKNNINNKKKNLNTEKSKRNLLKKSVKNKDNNNLMIALMNKIQIKEVSKMIQIQKMMSDNKNLKKALQMNLSQNLMT